MSGPTDFREETSISALDAGTGGGDIGPGGAVQGILGYEIDNTTDPGDGQIMYFEASSQMIKWKDQLTGIRTVYNNTGGQLNQFDVVIVDKTHDEAVTTTTTPQYSDGEIGVCLAAIGAGNSGPVQFSGYVPGMNVIGSVVRGSFAETSSTAAKATSSAARHKGSFAQFLQGLDSSVASVQQSGVLLGTAVTSLAPAGLTMNFNLPTVSDGFGNLVAVPNGVTLVLALYVGAGSSSPAITGWTRIGSTAGFRYYYRIASSEPASYPVTWTGSSQAVALVIAVDGLNTASLVAGFAYDATTAAAVISGLSSATYYAIAAVDNRVATPAGWTPVVDGASYSGALTPASIVQSATSNNPGSGTSHTDLPGAVTPGNLLILVASKVGGGGIGIDSGNVFVHGSVSAERAFTKFATDVFSATDSDPAHAYDPMVIGYRVATGDEQNLDIYNGNKFAIFEIANAGPASGFEVRSLSLQGAASAKSLGAFAVPGAVQIMGINWGNSSTTVVTDQVLGTGYSQDIQAGSGGGGAGHPGFLAAHGTTGATPQVTSGQSAVWAGMAIGITTSNPVVQAMLVTQTFTGTGVTSPFSGSSAQNDAIFAFAILQTPFATATSISALLFGAPDRDNSGGGSPGPEGPEGVEGPPGPPGLTGATGATGAQGPAGSGGGGGGSGMMPDDSPPDIVSDVMALINPRDRLAIQEISSGKAYDAERLIFDDNTTTDVGSGAVRVRGLPSGTVGCKVYHSVDQTVGFDVALALDSEEFDTDGFHDPVTNNSRITIPAGLSGKYLVIFMAEAKVSTADSNLRIRKNGSVSVGGSRLYLEQVKGTSGSVIVDLVATDYIEAIVGNIAGSGNTSIYGAATDTALRWTLQVIKLDSGKVGGGVGAACNNNSVAQAIANATQTGLTWTVNVKDTDGFHSTSVNTSRFTIPAGMSGWYLVSGSVALASSSATGARYVAVRINGTTYYGVQGFDPQTTIGEQYGATSAIVYMNAADYAEIVVYQTSTGSLNTVAQLYGSQGQIMRLDSNASGVLASGKITKTDADFTTASATFVDVTGLTLTLTTGARRCLVTFSASVANTTLDANTSIDLAIDGTRVGQALGLVVHTQDRANNTLPITFSFLTDVLSAGSHTFKIQMAASAGTGKMWAAAGSGVTPAILSVQEQPDSGALAASGSAPAVAYAQSRITTGGSDLTTASGSAVEIDSSLRVSVVVPASGRVLIRQSLVVMASIVISDAQVYVQVDGAGGWSIVGAIAFSTGDATHNHTVTGELLLTGLSPGLHTFYMGWSQAGGATLTCQNHTRGGTSNGTWQSATTLP